MFDARADQVHDSQAYDEDVYRCTQASVLVEQAEQESIKNDAKQRHDRAENRYELQMQTLLVRHEKHVGRVEAH